jgi:hypothetical protein
MRAHHIYFILLKIIIAIQFALILFKKQTSDSEIYIITDTIFKISIAIYLFVFSWVFSFKELAVEDALIIRFSGVILLYDIDFKGLLKIFRKYVPALPKVPYVEDFRS